MQLARMVRNGHSRENLTEHVQTTACKCSDYSVKCRACQKGVSQVGGSVSCWFRNVRNAVDSFTVLSCVLVLYRHLPVHLFLSPTLFLMNDHLSHPSFYLSMRLSVESIPFTSIIYSYPSFTSFPRLIFPQGQSFLSAFPCSFSLCPDLAQGVFSRFPVTRCRLFLRGGSDLAANRGQEDRARGEDLEVVGHPSQRGALSADVPGTRSIHRSRARSVDPDGLGSIRIAKGSIRKCPEKTGSNSCAKKRKRKAGTVLRCQPVTALLVWRS